MKFSSNCILIFKLLRTRFLVQAKWCFFHREGSTCCLTNKIFRNGLSLLVITLLFASCSVSKQISRQAKNILLQDTAINAGHIGISIYEPATGKYWYNYDATKYFVPASNVKLFSLYVGMKYLGDSLAGLRYTKLAGQSPADQPRYLIQATGDPTFLHPDFLEQPIINFLKKDSLAIFELENSKKTFSAFGRGWAWDDYNEGYMAERSAFPVYGNEFTFTATGDTIESIPTGITLHKQAGDPVSTIDFWNKRFIIKRNQFTNDYNVIFDASFPVFSKSEIPFITDMLQSVKLLKDTVKNIRLIFSGQVNEQKAARVIHSRPSDSVFIPMMHRSDNFFAEQTLLMASDELLGYMDDEKMIETILSTDLKDIPQKPKWVDGSGLSRYNLFTPQSIVYLLYKLKNEFGMDRLKNILPTGGEGTLSAYFKKDAGFIFAKTGTLSNHCALSGFIITQKNKLLIFSILTNHYPTSSTPVRRAVEKFLLGIRAKY